MRHKTPDNRDALKASQQAESRAFRRAYQRELPLDSGTLRQRLNETVAMYAAFGMESHPDAVADLAPLREALALLEDAERQEAFSASYFPEDCFPRNILSNPNP